MTERRAGWPGVEQPVPSPDDGGPACLLLLDLASRLAALDSPESVYSFEVEDIRSAFPMCPLGRDDDVVYVCELVVWSQRGRGLGRLLMEILTGLADHHRVSIVLVAAVIDHRPGGIESRDLEAWYGRLGFQPWYNANLIRRPSDNFTALD